MPVKQKEPDYEKIFQKIKDDPLKMEAAIQVSKFHSKKKLKVIIQLMQFFECQRKHKNQSSCPGMFELFGVKEK